MIKNRPGIPTGRPPLHTKQSNHRTVAKQFHHQTPSYIPLREPIAPCVHRLYINEANKVFIKRSAHSIKAHRKNHIEKIMNAWLGEPPKPKTPPRPYSIDHFLYAYQTLRDFFKFRKLILQAFIDQINKKVTISIESIKISPS